MIHVLFGQSLDINNSPAALVYDPAVSLCLAGPKVIRYRLYALLKIITCNLNCGSIQMELFINVFEEIRFN